jgi:hypothetical protein
MNEYYHIQFHKKQLCIAFQQKQSSSKNEVKAQNTHVDLAPILVLMMNIFLLLIPEYVSAPKRRVVAMTKLNAAVRLTRSARERNSGGGSGSSGGEAEGQTTGRGGGGGGGLSLPPLCLERIMCCLAEQAADPCGLVGPCLAARDIASASLACWRVLFCEWMGGRGVRAFNTTSSSHTQKHTPNDE